MDFNYESPITKIEQEIASQIVKTEEKELTYEIKKAIGYSIEKEELIKALQYDREQYEKGYNDGYNANKWIPVSERLPRPNTDVLTYRKDRAMPMFVDRYERYYGEDDGKYYEGWAYGANSVTAWKPLPQPYKAESEE